MDGTFAVSSQSDRSSPFLALHSAFCLLYYFTAVTSPEKIGLYFNSILLRYVFFVASDDSKVISKKSPFI